MEIKSIWASKSDGSVIIRGLPYTRNRNLRGQLDNKRNELSQVLEIDANDQRSDEAQALFQISPRQILRVRTLNKTNASYRRYCFGGERQWRGKTNLELEKQAPLTCRWKYRIEYKDARFRKYDRPDFSTIVKLTEAEADGRFRVSDKELTADFRGRTQRGGSYKPQVVNLDGSEVLVTRKDRQYTFADMFCGGGGTSRGAAMAELKLVFGVDRDPASCATWRLNFPGARMYEQDAADFINKNPEINYRSHPIDILHLSPPCQFWSPLAYPHAGRNNEENMAILFACPDVIEKIRPRLFTLEQTFGLTHDAHAEFLNALVRGFTSHGYSVQWRIVPLVEYGLPQTRKRLIMIGSCPGEPLPPWPPATHSATPADGLKPFVTEAQAIRNLNRRGVTLHDVANTLARNLPPRDANVPFPKTITCGGTQGTSHYSGLRDNTLREIACIQGFPVCHQFVGTKTAIKKQIGNAFAPCVVKAFYDHLRTWLRRVDGVEDGPAQAHRPVPRGIPAPALPAEPRHQHHVNGDLGEDEALQLALQESMYGYHTSASGAIIEIPDEEDSPVSAVAPLLERMSIAPSDHRAESDPRSRSRSVTLGRSLSPSPGPSRHHSTTASQKRSLDSMHDGEVDEVQKEESPPKRERAEEHEGVVDDSRIPSSLPRYAGPSDARDADDENVVVGQSNTGSSLVHEDRDSHRGTAGEDITPGESAIDWSSILSQARMAGNSGDAVWTF